MSKFIINYSLNLSHMYTKNTEGSSSLSLKTDIDTMTKMFTNMTLLQGTIKRKITELQQQTQRKRITKQVKLNQIRDEMQGFKQFFKTFGEECKNEWISVYKELLQIIHSIVELYQIKIGKLETKIQEQQHQIDCFEKRSSSNIFEQKLFTQNNQSQYDCKPLTQTSQDLMQLSNGKKIKISDVIASYQSSILSINGGNIDDNEQFGLENVCNDHNKSICEKSFIKGSETSIQYSIFSKFNPKEKKDNYQCQLSLGENFNTQNERNQRKGSQGQLNQKQNFPSFVSSCRKLSDFPESRRDQSKSGRVKNRQSTEGSSASKLSDLRRYLYNRKRN